MPGGWSVPAQVTKELRLTYDQIRALPSLERPVLLICPGFFANHGRWKGISLAELAKRAGLKKGVNFVTVSGPAGPYEKTVRFPWKDAVSGKVFLAYQVNGEPLPVKHGYPAASGGRGGLRLGVGEVRVQSAV